MRRTVLTRIRPVLDWLFKKKINHTSIYFENGRTGRCTGAAMSSAHPAKGSEVSTVLLLLRLEDAKEMGATDTKRFPLVSPHPSWSGGSCGPELCSSTFPPSQHHLSLCKSVPTGLLASALAHLP